MSYITGLDQYTPLVEMSQNIYFMVGLLDKKFSGGGGWWHCNYSNKLKAPGDPES